MGHFLSAVHQELVSIIKFAPMRTTTEFLCRECLPSCGGLLPHVAELIDRYLDEFLPPRVFEAACGGGASTDALEHLLARSAPDWREAVNTAARGGHLHVLEWMVTKRNDGRGPWRAEFLYAPNVAAEHGQLEVLKWLDGNFSECDWDDAIWNAVYRGHLAVLQWLKAYYIGWREPMLFEKAAQYGHLEVVQWLREHLPGPSPEIAMPMAACNGHFEVVKWLYEHQLGSELSWALQNASGGGHLEIVQWLFARGAKVEDSEVVEWAARSGNLELVKWFHSHFNEHFSPQVMDEAAKNGNLDVVKWLHEHRNEGCTTDAMDLATLGGHLDTVQWLDENRSEGCTTDAMDWAAMWGRLDVVRYLHQHRKEGCTDDGMKRAALNGHIEVVCYLYDNSINRYLDIEFRNAADFGPLDLLQLSLEKQIDSSGSYWCLIQCVGEMLKETRTWKHCMSSNSDNRDAILCKTLGSMEWLRERNHTGIVTGMLDTLLTQGEVGLLRSFLSNKSDTEYRRYVDTSQKFGYVALMRWLIENGTELDLQTTQLLVRDDEYGMKNIEVVLWLSERTRAQLLVLAMREQWKGWRELLAYSLKHTAFEDVSCRQDIRDALATVSGEAVQWEGSLAPIATPVVFSKDKKQRCVFEHKRT